MSLETTRTLGAFIESYRDAKGDFKYLQLVRSERPLVIDFYDLYDYNPEAARRLIESPLTSLEAIGGNTQKCVRIRHLVETTPIRHIGSEHIDKLIQIHGIVTKSHPDSSKMKTTAFKCDNCYEINYVPQDNQFLKYPKECGGCKGRKFEIDFAETEYIDSQQIYIQESPEQLPPGETPIVLKINLCEDLVKSANPGDRVNVVGIIQVYQSRPGSPKLELQRYLEANYVEVINRETDLLALTEEEKQEITDFSERDDFFEAIAANIAPDIYGLEYAKKATALQLVGGGRLEKEYSSRRGDPNVLLVGDPGIGKSEILEYVARLSPRGILASSGGATKAGLTASAIQDKDGGFVIEAGAMVLADQGICCIDEFEKINDQDRSAIHPAMEQQKVHVAKGGKVATLNARCAVLAAANPTHGRYEPSLSITENLKNFPVTLLSRFDLIFILRDKPNKDEDRLIAKKILGTLGEEVPTLSPDFLRKYFSYAKTFRPKMTEGLYKYLEEYYVKLRTQPNYQNAISITPRQLESLVRLALSHARLRLSDTATLEDGAAIIELFEKSMSDVGIDPTTGSVDIDLIYSGIPASLRDRISKMRDVIEKLSGANIGGSFVEEGYLLEWICENWVIPNSEAKKILDVMVRDGAVFRPKVGVIKLVS